MAATNTPTSLFDITVTNAAGDEVPLSTFSDKKAILIVNVASKCGLTKQNYQELADLYDKYSDQGLEIIAMPCNQFGKQEPGTAQEVEAFAQSQGAKFPVFAKLDVNGPNTHILYKFLKQATGEEDISWNFAKFLVKGDGSVMKAYGPKENPFSFEADVAALLE